jgi:ABC-type multidrug transport system permease subunit
VGANWFNNRYEKKWNFWRLGFTAFGMFVILKLISLAPFVGWLIIILMACISFGSILLNIRWKRRQMTATVV